MTLLPSFRTPRLTDSSSSVAGLAWARGLVTGGSPSSGRLEVADTLEVTMEAGTLQPGHPLFSALNFLPVFPFSSNVSYMSAPHGEDLKPRFALALAILCVPDRVTLSTVTQ